MSLLCKNSVFFVLFDRQFYFFLNLTMKHLFLLLSLLIIVNQGFAQTNTYNIKGVVITENGYAGFATLGIEQLNAYTMADENGRFELKRIPNGRYKILAKRMGLIDVTTEVEVSGGDVTIEIKMPTATFKIERVEVMARRHKADKLEIGETAIEYLQPVSLGDLAVLLPGNIYTENSMTQFSLNSSRQVGSDKNSSLGIAITSDGVPQSSDGVRIQMVGITENTYSGGGDSQIKARSGINSGTDMRYISTDHIQSVEVNRGISSPKYGNLSAGQILVNSKYGVSPLRIRTKIDLKNKLFYAGKGFSLGPKAGTLHVGADFLYSYDDIREEMEKFSRITMQAYYHNQIKFNEGRSLDIDFKLAQTISANKMKKDELTYEYNETYKADYNKTDLMLKAKLNLNATWLENINITSSLNRVSDLIDRHYCVITANPKSMPLSYSEGESEGYYLPTMYYSDFYVENIPINFYTQINMKSRLQLAERLTLSLEYGVDFSSVKNRGDGAVIENEKLPPFPSDNSYMRPRRNYEIPAIETGAAYFLTSWNYRPSEHQSVKLDFGYRFTQMKNLDSDYSLYHKILAEPRINANYTIGDVIKNTVRFGYGIENKLPTMDYLYPEKIYKDFWVLNAYTNNADYRHLITYTKIFDAINYDISENKNQKIEGGYDFSIKNFEISLTAFYEISTSGFEYFTFYTPVTYPYFSELKPDADISGRRPEKTDYIEDTFSEFTTFTQVQNSEKVTKRGFEYRIITPEIKTMKTNVEINGAYYYTVYGSSLPSYFYPNSRIGNSMYQYVGIYDLDAKNNLRRFNTNFWFNTHIPKFRMVFTNFFQFIWMQTKQYTDNYEGIYKKTPYQYIDFQNVTHDVTPEIAAQINDNSNILWNQLRRQSTTLTYATEEKPIYMMWNIKVTKEFSDNAKLSFFVNGILDIHPQYSSGTSARTKREWSNPFFGMELILNIAKTKGE